ncbi:MAG TPA: tetratricopeptide repeat protein, partial [Thermoplasmata archaeon]|nr:tetratricopeptide repeat protein [Thermoplasmata archaeon]
MEPRFFLNPVLVGGSIYSKLRSGGSAALLLGPTSRSDVQLMPSADLERSLTELNPQLVQRDQLRSLYKRCDSILAHLVVPLKVDTPKMLLAEDAVAKIMTIVQKVNALETMFPQEGLSDLYIRMGIVYWNSIQSVLFKTSSSAWRDSKRAYLISKAKEYFSKVNQSDDLYSIAARNRGMLCLEAQEWTEAEEYLSQAMGHFENDVKIGEAIARAHLGLGNTVEALSRVDETINLGEKPELWVLKGRILESMERYDDAIECFNRALVLNPKYMPAYDVMIDVLKRTGKTEQA